jgi:hypothetical protein
MESVMEKNGVAGVSSLPPMGKRNPMKFRNGDISLDDAVENIINSGEEFNMPNSDLLVRAVMNTPW